MSAGDRPTRPSISDGLFYWVAGACGFATGIVGGAFHLGVDALLRWPIWLTERLGPGPLTIAAAAGIAAVGTTLAFLLTQRIAPEASGSGVPEVEGALEGLREVRWRRVLPVKFVGSSLVNFQSASSESRSRAETDCAASTPAQINPPKSDQRFANATTVFLLDRFPPPKRRDGEPS